MLLTFDSVASLKNRATGKEDRRFVSRNEASGKRRARADDDEKHALFHIDQQSCATIRHR